MVSRCERFLPACSLCFRAIYFAAYSKAKEIFNGLLVPNSGAVHMSSAGVAGELVCMLARADLSQQREEEECPTESPRTFCLPPLSFRYELSDEPRLDGQDQDAAGEKVRTSLTMIKVRMISHTFAVNPSYYPYTTLCNFPELTICV